MEITWKRGERCDILSTVYTAKVEGSGGESSRIVVTRETFEVSKQAMGEVQHEDTPDERRLWLEKIEDGVYLLTKVLAKLDSSLTTSQLESQNAELLKAVEVTRERVHEMAQANSRMSTKMELLQATLNAMGLDKRFCPDEFAADKLLDLLVTRIEQKDFGHLHDFVDENIARRKRKKAQRLTTGTLTRTIESE